MNAKFCIIRQTQNQKILHRTSHLFINFQTASYFKLARVYYHDTWGIYGSSPRAIKLWRVTYLLRIHSSARIESRFPLLVFHAWLDVFSLTFNIIAVLVHQPISCSNHLKFSLQIIMHESLALYNLAALCWDDCVCTNLKCEKRKHVFLRP